MKKIHDFYNRALEDLHVAYEEQYIDTRYGSTHLLAVGYADKKPIFTLHGGNGISPLNIRLFRPLLKSFCIIAPDVIGMPGKSESCRRLNSSKEEYGFWLCDILDYLHIEKVPFVVSSYSSAMMLSLAKIAPKRIEKAVLLAPSGITHGPIIPMMHIMLIPFVKYYSCPSKQGLINIVDTMMSENDTLWLEFMDLMMSSYKMEMHAPKEYRERELKEFYGMVLFFASNEDIFFPADKVFAKAKRIFKGEITTCLIQGKHLPSEETMEFVCHKTMEFLI